MTQSLTSAVQRLLRRAPLVGLNSVDFLVSDEQFWLLEVNPRPGATLDIFEPDNALDDTVCAAYRRLQRNASGPPPRQSGARAADVLRAECDVRIVAAV